MAVIAANPCRSATLLCKSCVSGRVGKRSGFNNATFYQLFTTQHYDFHPSIHPSATATAGCRAAWANPSRPRREGGVTTFDKLPVWSQYHTERPANIHTHTYTDYGDLTVFFLDCGRKPDYLERTHTHTHTQGTSVQTPHRKTPGDNHCTTLSLNTATT